MPELPISSARLVDLWSTDRYRIEFFNKTHRPIGCLACPARFERATYALEEFVAAGMSIYFNDLDA